MTPPEIYGVMAEFATPEEAARAARGARENGFVAMDAFGPFPSAELTEAIGFREKKIAPCVLGGGIAGGLLGYGLVYYATVLDYPHNIGGHPFNSWPSFIPIAFETTILFATLTGIVSLLVLNRLPRLAHPVFSVRQFERATTDHFFVCLLADDPAFSVDKARDAFAAFSPLSIAVVMKEESP